MYHKKTIRVYQVPTIPCSDGPGFCGWAVCKRWRESEKEKGKVK